MRGNRLFFFVIATSLCDTEGFGVFRTPVPTRVCATRLHNFGSSETEYYGDGNSFIVKEFNEYAQLQAIVEIASKPLPQRPDGVVTVVKYTSASQDSCRATEAEYERLARENPATIFMRCFQEYPEAGLLLGQLDVTVLPTFDLFYGGNRVGRIEGTNHDEVDDLLQKYQLQNSNLDLFSEEADNQRRLAIEDGKSVTRTPRTSNRYIAGYDWDKDRGFFDDAADNFQEQWDDAYENWVPDIQDE